MAGEIKSAPGGDRLLGVLMIASALLFVLVMGHHPHDFHHRGLAEFVHGALMALTLVLIAGAARFAMRERLGRPAMLLGLVAFVAGSAGNLLAATLNGFVAPALAVEGAYEQFGPFVWELNQALAYEAVFAVSASLMFFGLGLLRTARGFQQIAGGVLLGAGVVSASLLAFGVVSMNVQGAFVVYGLHMAAMVIIGFLLVRSKIA